MRVRGVLAFSVIMLWLCTCGDVRADLITYGFTGSVTYVDPALTGTFNTAQILYGTFTYESTTAKTASSPQCSNGNSCYSDYPVAVTNLVMTVGSYAASTPFTTVGSWSDGIQVANDWYGKDSLIVSGVLGNAVQLAGFPPTAFIGLWDYTQSAFSDTSLTHVGDLTGWTNLANRTGSWYLFFGSPEGNPPGITGISGSLTSVYLTSRTQVPEPNSAVILVVGGALTLLLASRTRRSRKPSTRVDNAPDGFPRPLDCHGAPAANRSAV